MTRRTQGQTQSFDFYLILVIDSTTEESTEVLFTT